MGEKKYDWIDDPFKEESQQPSKMSTKSKLAVGGGCLVVLIGTIVIFLLFIDGIINAISV